MALTDEARQYRDGFIRTVMNLDLSRAKRGLVGFEVSGIRYWIAIPSQPLRSIRQSHDQTDPAKFDGSLSMLAHFLAFEVREEIARRLDASKQVHWDGEYAGFPFLNHCHRRSLRLKDGRVVNRVFLGKKECIPERTDPQALPRSQVVPSSKRNLLDLYIADRKPPLWGYQCDLPKDFLKYNNEREPRWPPGTLAVKTPQGYRGFKPNAERRPRFAHMTLTPMGFLWDVRPPAHRCETNRRKVVPQSRKHIRYLPKIDTEAFKLHFKPPRGCKTRFALTVWKAYTECDGNLSCAARRLRMPVSGGRKRVGRIVKAVKAWYRTSNADA